MHLSPRDQLIRLAHHFGSDPEYARAGGGNASVKVDGVLHIKPSGTMLADLRDEDLVPLRLEPLFEALVSDEPVEGDPVMVAAERARVGDPAGRRPSVEILFHALIADPLVIHLHPLVANAVTCNEDGRQLTADLLGDEALWVDYIDPGIPLARGIAAARVEFESHTGRHAPAITMLGNHGIIVSGDTFEEVAQRTTWLTSTIAAAIAAAGPDAGTDAAAGAVSTLDNAGSAATLTTLAEQFRVATESRSVVLDADAFIAATTGPSAGPVSRGPMIPDQIVYAGSLPVLLREDDDADAVAHQVARFRGIHGRSPVVAVIPRVAAFAVGEGDKAARNALDTYRDALRMARDADRIGRVRVMDQSERTFIENWEAESYRRSVAATA
ncbi:class II aldolase/adducin family protein [Tessaracoccus antarcticus]|uniref:Class II aldolase n=1 Tax=Tessaracoccus antarcticus TaxID=2479848 RepID=A0A3M0FYR7_9ACTN|nr:class II aldolase/adducin family protein [Tessaracoccus antarcticus]RMB57880.1 class II aldolase [Tessaracoccus antarcticus]